MTDKLSREAPNHHKIIPITKWPKKQVKSAFWKGINEAKIEAYEGKGWV